MRLFSKNHHRAFRELDKLSDEQCGLLMKNVKGQFSTHLLIIYAIGSTIFSSLIFGGMFTMFIVGMLEDQVQVPNEIILSVVITINVALLLIACFFIRDLILESIIKGAIRKHIKKTGCIACGYTLMGLTAENRSPVRSAARSPI